MQDGDEEEVLKPRVHESVFVAEGAQIYGDVEIGEGSSVWFNAVIRGDEGKIRIGRNTNIQDNVVIHSDMMVGVEIGDNVGGYELHGYDQLGNRGEQHHRSELLRTLQQEVSTPLPHHGNTGETGPRAEGQ
ncbi:MAG: gamma carbonic anhydrase family protein [Candidatus Freyarchaeota archaeon]